MADRTPMTADRKKQKDEARVVKSNRFGYKYKFSNHRRKSSHSVGYKWPIHGKTNTGTVASTDKKN